MLVVFLVVFCSFCAATLEQRIVAIDYGGEKNTTAGVFFEHYRSNMPVAMLVDNTREAHQDAEVFVRTVDETRLNTIMLEFLLMKFNSSGVTQIQTSSVEDKLLFNKLLKWSENYEISSTVGSESTNSTALFFGILNAANTLPYNSGILIFTDRAVLDEDLANLALQEVRRKRIRIFVIWGGVSPGVTNEEKLLREIAVYSGGLFIVNTDRKLSEKYNKLYMETRDSTTVKQLVLFRKNLHGQQVFNFPINSDVTEIHISISFSAVSALLTPPNGYVLNIFNDMDVENFSFGSFLISAPHLRSYEVQLNIAQHAAPRVGIWHLYVGSSNTTDPYNVTVSVQTALMATVSFQKKKNTEIQNSSPNLNKQLMKLELSGDITEVKRITFLDERGEPLRKNIEFTLNKKAEELTEDTESIEPTSGNEIDIETESIPNTPFYVKIAGTDINGTEFSRITYYNTRNTQFTLPTLTVEVGLGSQLLVIPNQYSKIFFEVTNNRAQTVFVRFRCIDDKSFLVRMDPISSWLNPHQTVIVTLITNPRYTSQTSYRDLITFVVTGADQIEKKVYMDISDNVIDYDDPYITYKYTSDCMNVLLGNCEDGTWSIEVTAQDTGSGILQLTSNPTGLYFPSGYISGTTEKITGYYTGSCCQPKLQITAADRVGNRKIYTADAYYAYLSAGSIAAIVLAVIIIILIIIGIILLCKFATCACCGSRESVDLPTYRGPSGSTRRN